MCESWLIEKARKSKDPYASESWMLMAKTMLATGSYELCISTYDLYFQKRNAVEAADTLQKLYMKYSTDGRFWEEASKLAKAIEPKVESEETRFRREVFQKLIPELQQSLLLDLADRTKDAEEKCRIYLLCLRMFKDSLAAFGIELIRILRELKDENRSGKAESTESDWYQEVLVTKVVPALLKFSELPMSEDLCVDLLKESILFYTRSALTSLGQTAKKSDSEFEQLVQLMRLAGERFDWQHAKTFPTLRFDEVKVFLKKIRSADRERKRTETHYSALISLAWLVVRYMRNRETGWAESVLVVMPPDIHDITGIESLPTVDSPFPKKLKHDSEKYPFLARNSGDVDWLKEVFATALSCWELLVTKKGLIREVFGTALNSRVRDMLTDAMMVEKQFEECAAVIEKGLETQPEAKEASFLFKLSSCCFVLNRQHDARRCAAEAMEMLRSELILDACELPSGSCLTYLYLPHCLQFVCRLLFSCNAHFLSLKEPADPNGKVIGEIIILSQAYWPHYKHLFKRAVQLIERKGSFSYPNFFNYVRNLEILEEFSYISERRAKVVLNITETESVRKAGLSTRHSVKGAKDEIRQLLEIGAKTFKKSIIPGELRRFIIERKLDLIAP